MSSPLLPAGTCPECGAPLREGQAQCWLCQRNTRVQSAENPYAPPRSVAGENGSWQFSLASLLLVITLVAVCLGLFKLAPGLGILFAIVAMPALIRTEVAVRYRRQAGAASSPAEIIGTFLISWFMMGAIGLAASVAFLAVCGVVATATELAVPKSIGESQAIVAILGFGVISGLIAAIPLAAWLLRQTSPVKMGSPKRDA